jgi:hypothetical protein
MTDKELLELAAKAAGITLSHWDKARNTFAPVIGVAGEWWNPLTDDGDALRLAVKLGMDVCVYTKPESAHATHAICFLKDYDSTIADEMESHGNDPYAATRRAITRAAAEIGKTKMIDVVNFIFDFESGNLSNEDIIKNFQALIDSGTVWQLQGSYGRTAQQLIDKGYCHD